MVSFTGFFEDYIFAWWNIWVFHNSSSFALIYFLMQMAELHCDTPLVLIDTPLNILPSFILFYIWAERCHLCFEGQYSISKILRVAWTSSVEVGLVCCCALTKHKRFVLKRMFLFTSRHKTIFIWVGVSFLPCPRLTLGQFSSVGLNLDHNPKC